MLRSTYSVGVTGVVGGSYTITVNIAAIAPLSTPNITGVLSLDPSVGNSSFVFTSPTIMLLTIPDSYNASTDVMLVWQLESPYGQTVCAIRNVLPSIQGCWQINYYGLPRITPLIYYGFERNCTLEYGTSSPVPRRPPPARRRLRVLTILITP
jgi:hypothetical protein